MIDCSQAQLCHFSDLIAYRHTRKRACKLIFILQSDWVDRMQSFANIESLIGTPSIKKETTPPATAIPAVMPHMQLFLQQQQHVSLKVNPSATIIDSSSQWLWQWHSSNKWQICKEIMSISQRLEHIFKFVWLF